MRRQKSIGGSIFNLQNIERPAHCHFVYPSTD
jgi:hypothetical protein